MGFDRIVVGVDGSVEARAALAWAAGQVDGDLVVVYGISQWAELAWASVQVNPSLILGEAKTLLDDSWCEPAVEAGVPCQKLTREEEPATALLSVADSSDADLIVVGSHSHMRWTPHYLGSVASKLLHKSSRPVAIVPRPLDRTGGETGRVVVGVDGSESSRRALAWAISHAVDTDREVRALWVVDERLFYTSAWAPAIDIHQLELDSASALSDIVEAELDRLEAEVTVEGEVTYGDPALHLTKEAEDADLLVLGIGHPEYMPELVIGSVPRRCATQSPCPVIFVPGGSTD